ncbi:MAG TPA: S41 family peptidase [Vitreimonas sp.]|uniref:S41 family peptidase n=1 Tax=Vitreimonas sp. TaxID=3069702 RepID=UPI002D28A338|nr:S41 family peptidase [Vitreimonas sp.]HYD87070.1 S41 family peptidase [Vitreimonas sp.]
MLGLRSAAIAAAAALVASSAAAQENRYGRLYEALWSTVNENYYDPHFRGADWAAQRERYRARATSAQTDAEFYEAASAMLREIPSSHLHISSPAQSSTGDASIGARFTQMGEDLVVAEVAPLSDAYRQGLRAGDRLLSERSALYGDLGTRASLRIRTCEGRRRTLDIRREGAFWPPEHPGFRWRQIRTGRDTRVGYMRIDRFDDGAAGLADQAMSELSQVDAIIIDVRNNSGGNVSAQRLAAYFNGGRAEPGVILLARSYLEALGRPVTAADLAAAPRIDGAYTTNAVFAAMSEHNGGAAFWTEAIENKFTGPVFVLISEETGSAAEGFAWYMRERTRARLIGTQTAGALLSSESFDLGDGWRVTIPVHGLWGPDGQDYGDRAVPPHEQIAPTREDLCAGRDPVLEAALDQAMR